MKAKSSCIFGIFLLSYNTAFSRRENWLIGQGHWIISVQKQMDVRSSSFHSQLHLSSSLSMAEQDN